MAATTVSILTVSDLAGSVASAGKVLREGGVVILPTETLYGVGAALRNPAALARVRAMKASGGEPRPLTLHLGRREDAEQFVGKQGEFASRLMRKLWPGPVGLVFEVGAEQRAKSAKALGVSESELYEEGLITLRCPDHPITLEILQAAGEPVVVTQAPTPTGVPALKASDVASEAVEKADLVVDAGATRFNKPSTLLRVLPESLGGYQIIRAGVYDERIIERMLKTTLLFVCSGNTCRSPMAWALARRAVAEKLGVPEEEIEKKGVNIISAGSFAMPGARATPEAVDAVKDYSADLSKHRSRPLTVELIHQADRIYTMGRNHKAAVLSLVPGASDKVETLDPQGDIDDPIGSDLSVYRALANEMNKLIRKRIDEQPLP